MSFFPFSLRNLAKSFGLSVEKGDFPHLFNKMINFDYIGDYPSPSFYGITDMSPEDRRRFLTWYSTKKDSLFNFQEEILLTMIMLKSYSK